MFELAAAALLMGNRYYLPSTNTAVRISREEQRLSMEVQKAVHIMNQPWRDLAFDIEMQILKSKL